MISVLRTHMNPKHLGQEELTLDAMRPGSWVNLTAPSRQELEDVARATSVPLDFLSAALDVEESSRIDIEEPDEAHAAAVLMVVNIPKRLGGFKFDTIPLGIVITEDCFITVCLDAENAVLPGPHGGVSGFCTWKRTRFLLQILYKAAETYLQYLNEMNRMSDRLENSMRRAMRNEELFNLMELQKGMTFFTGSLRSNRVAVEKLLRVLKNPQFHELVKLREEDEDLMEDVTIEYDQAYDMVRVYTEVLGGMMDAAASIISNNLNIVMKFLAAVTIILSIPMLVSGLWGMNVPVPLAEHPWGFPLVLLFSIALSAAAVAWLWRKKMF